MQVWYFVYFDLLVWYFCNIFVGVKSETFVTDKYCIRL